MSANTEWLNQLVFLASVLAGFSLTVAVQLVAMKERARVAYWATGAFIASASALLASTTIGTLMLIRWELWQQATLTQLALARIRFARSSMNSLLMIGLVLFLTGLGLAGWLHSRLIGVISVLAVLLTALVIFWAIRALP